MTRPVPVLMYHAVSDHPAPDARSHAVTPAAFARQLEHLHAAGFTPVTATTLAELLRGQGAMPAKPVAITFDDGYADFVDNALPQLERFGFTATVFVTTGWTRDDIPIPVSRTRRRASVVADAEERIRPPDRMLSWRQIAAIADRGVEIGGHSHTHPQLDQLGEADAHAEVTRCKQLLQERLGRPVTSFAYPYGYSSARVRRAVAAAGYACAFAVNNALAGPGHDPLALPRLTIAGPHHPARFDDAVHGRRIPLLYARERALTRGYAVARHARRAAVALTGTLTGTRTGTRTGRRTPATGAETAAASAAEAQADVERDQP